MVYTLILYTTSILARELYHQHIMPLYHDAIRPLYHYVLILYFIGKDRDPPLRDPLKYSLDKT